MKEINKNIPIQEEPNEEDARKNELFPGEVDKLNRIVSAWLRIQPQKKEDKENK